MASPLPTTLNGFRTRRAYAPTLAERTVGPHRSSSAALSGSRHRSAFGWQLALQGLFLITLTPDVWGDRFLPVARVAMLLVLFYVVVALEARRATRPAATPTVAARVPTARDEPRG